MKRNGYGLVITVISIVLVAVFAIQQLGGLSLLSRSDSNQIHTPDYVDGDYVGYIAPESGRVTDGKSALAAAAEIFGVEEDTLSVSLEDDTELNDDEKYYKLQQMSGDLPVYGRHVNLSVDGGEVYLASGSLSNRNYDIDVTPEINEDSAWESLYDYVLYNMLDGENPENPEDLAVYVPSFGPESLCIYDQGEYENNPRLAYDCTFTYSGGSGEEYVSGSYDVVIDAHSAEVLSAVSNVYASAAGVDYNDWGKIYHADLEKEGNEYIFRDESRNMALYDLKGGNAVYSMSDSVHYSYDDITHLTALEDEVFRATTDLDDWEENDIHAQILLSDVQGCYDFYEEVLGRKGFNNGNGETSILLNQRYTGEYTAYSKTLGNATVLVFTEKFDVKELDVAGHEFTHSVEQSISHMVYRGQSAAIMEGYSDTFGILIEEYVWGSSDWICSGRDARDAPPLHFGDEHLTNSTDAQDEDSSWKYEYLYVVSHRAYNIWTGWDDLEQTYSHSEKISDMAHLFYRALFLMDTCSSFSNWYWAMGQVAGYMLSKGELTQEQYDVVMGQFDSGTENKNVKENSLDPLQTVAVLIAQNGESSLTDEIKELASAPLIPKIEVTLNAQVGKDPDTVDMVDYGYYGSRFSVMIHKKAVIYYMAALYGEEYAKEFVSNISSSQYYKAFNEAYYRVFCESEEQIRKGWTWDITETVEIDDCNVMYFATMESPEGALYDVRFTLTLDDGRYTGGFLNGHYLSGMTVTVIQEAPKTDEVLLDWLDSLVQQCGVMEVGTEEYYSASGGFEHVVPDSRITGLLAADIDDYDGDGCNELFVVRVEPHSAYSTGPAQEAGQTDISLEVYGVQDGEIREYSYTTFPLLGLPETWYHAAAHVFKVKDEDGVKLYFDHFFSFNSQTFATIQLEYIDESLCVTGGAELDEFAYSASCYRAVSDEACGTILGRQSYDIGQDGWEEYCSGYWEDYGDTYEEVTWDTFQGYNTLMNGMGLTESISRSMFWGDWDGGAYASLQAEYGRCYLRPTDHFTANNGTIQAICSLIAPYGQGSVTLTAEDETELLYPYRTGTVNALNSGSNNSSNSSTASGGYDSPTDVFNAVGDVFFHGTAEDMLELYADRQLQCRAALAGCSEDTFCQYLTEKWEDSWPDTSYILTFGMGETGAVQLSEDEIESKFGTNAATPDQAARIQMNAYCGYSSSKAVYELVIYAVCYDGRWYLSAIDE